MNNLLRAGGEIYHNCLKEINNTEGILQDANHSSTVKKIRKLEYKTQKVQSFFFYELTRQRWRKGSAHVAWWWLCHGRVCIVVSGSGSIVFIDDGSSRMNAEVFTDILSVSLQKNNTDKLIRRTFIMQLKEDPRRTHCLPQQRTSSGGKMKGFGLAE